MKKHNRMFVFLLLRCYISYACTVCIAHLHNHPSTVLSIFKQPGQQKAPHMVVGLVFTMVQFFQMLQSDDVAKVDEKCWFIYALCLLGLQFGQDFNGIIPIMLIMHPRSQNKDRLTNDTIPGRL